MSHGKFQRQLTLQEALLFETADTCQVSAFQSALFHGVVPKLVVIETEGVAVAHVVVLPTGSTLVTVNACKYSYTQSDTLPFLHSVRYQSTILYN